jgi:hypothetical protein
MKFNLENTGCATWFERNRGYVILSYESGCEEEIFALWDEQVSEFVEDGFKRANESWHEALVRYVNEHGFEYIEIPEEEKAGAK